MLRKMIAMDILLVIGLALFVTGIFIMIKPTIEIPEKNPEKIYITGNYKLDYPAKANFKEDEKVVIVIPSGISALTIGTILDEKGLISSKDFIALLKLFPFQKRIRAGEYIFNKNDSIVDILDKIILK